MNNSIIKTKGEEIVLFPFDDHSIPFWHGLRMQLLGRGGRRQDIVVSPGPPGSPDNKNVVYYGTVIRVGDELWMWYLGQGDLDDHWHQRVCFAKSKDGYHWEKPNLGLLEYGGNSDNNLVDLLRGEHNVTACVVFYEPDDPDPKRKFKMAFESRHYKAKLAVAYSEDGLRWVESPKNPVGPIFEMAGGTKFNGAYYITGQDGWYYPTGVWRRLETHVSYDFENWIEATCLGFRRDYGAPEPMEKLINAEEQVHLGAGLWNRGNVIVGFYGQWHGHPSNDRRLITMDLGLVVSNDALHYREPIPNFRIVSAAEDGWTSIPYGTTSVHFPALIQGQGFENVGDKTLFWYAPWPEQDSDGVRITSWDRDRLGYFESFLAPRHGKDIYFISAPIDLDNKPVRVYINVDGISEHSQVTVDILDEKFNVIADYSKEECATPSESGLRQLVTWQGREVVEKVDNPIRVRVNFGGLRPEDLKVYAVYLVPKNEGDGG